jgi:DNA-binding CsgD family transcriptional regulator
MASGIYRITNTITGMIYIGQAKDIDKRWKQHIDGLDNQRHANRYLRKAWAEHGKNAFKFEVLEHCKVDQLTEREQYYLDIHTPTGNCYNIAKNAHTPSKGYSMALFEGGVARASDDELLALLNEHKTIKKVASIIGMSEGGLFNYLQRNGFKKEVVYHWRYRISEAA